MAKRYNWKRLQQLYYDQESILYIYDFAQNEEETDELANRLDAVEKEIKVLERAKRMRAYR